MSGSKGSYTKMSDNKVLDSEVSDSEVSDSKLSDSGVSDSPQKTCRDMCHISDNVSTQKQVSSRDRRDGNLRVLKESILCRSFQFFLFFIFFLRI